MDKAEVIEEAVKYITDHLKIEIKQNGPCSISAKLFLETNSETKKVICEDSTIYDPRPIKFRD